MASLTNYANNPRNNTNPRRISLLLLPILISITSTVLLSTKMMSTLNNNTNSIDNSFSTFDNVFGDSIKRQMREVELDYLMGSGAPPNNIVGNDDHMRKAQVAQYNNNIISTSNNNIMVNSMGSRTARYHAIKDAKQQQLLQLDEQTSTKQQQLLRPDTQRRDEIINKSTKVVHKQLFKPQDNEKTIQQQLFKPEIEDDDMGNTIELESTADIEVDENTNLILLQSQSGGIKSAGVESGSAQSAGVEYVEIEITNNEVEDIKSRENGPRPRRNPKGIRWNGWFVDNSSGSKGSSRWIDSGKLDLDHDGIDDRDELGDEIEGSIRDENEDRKEEEREMVDKRILPRNVGDNAW